VREWRASSSSSSSSSSPSFVDAVLSRFAAALDGEGDDVGVVAVLPELSRWARGVFAQPREARVEACVRVLRVVRALALVRRAAARREFVPVAVSRIHHRIVCGLWFFRRRALVRCRLWPLDRQEGSKPRSPS